MKDPKLEFEQLEAECRVRFGSFKSETELSVSPFFKARVMATVRAIERKPRFAKLFEFGLVRRFLFMRSHFVYGAAAVLVVGLGGLGFSIFKKFQNTLLENGFSVAAYQPVSLRLDTKKLVPKGITHAVIQLPDGVSFYSAKFPAIQEQDHIKLPVPQSELSSTVPVVIQASMTGVKWVRVKFVDEQDRTIEEKLLKIHFNAGTKSKSKQLEPLHVQSEQNLALVVFDVRVKSVKIKTVMETGINAEAGGLWNS